MKYYVYDIEFFPNFFCIVFRHYKSGKVYQAFEISVRKDERERLLEFLNQENITLIGYNNVHYDYPVIHYLMENPETTLKSWFNYVKRNVIEDDSFIIWESQHLIPQIDLFLIWHYNNKARITSLKWLEFTTRWYKVQDLPMTPNIDVPEDKFDEMIEYCKNDVDFTYNFTEKSSKAIKFRMNMSEKLGINVMNFSDVKIGEYVNRKTYEELSGIRWKEFKNLRSPRKVFRLEDIIPKDVCFKTKYMQDFLNEIKSKSFKEGEEFDRHLNIGGVTLKFAKGGLHSEDEPRVVKCKDGWSLVEKDIGSMYPWTIISDKIYPEHLGVEWNEGIKQSFNYRAFELKPQLKNLKRGTEEYEKLDHEQEVYKLSMNGGGFGKLGSMFSWQFDPLAKFRVTIGGELKMLMLIEDFAMNDIDIVSVNTDGVVIHYPNEMQELVDDIHSKWEKKTTYILEDTFYNQLIFSSVNDYIAEIINPETGERDKIKFKGDFEIDKDYHKNNSQRIVPIALMEHYINGVSVKDVIGNLNYKFINSKGEEEETSIYDYCIGRKKTRNCTYYVIENGRASSISDKVIRYYISNSNAYLLKKYTGGKKEGTYQKINAGFKVQMFMEFEEKESYNIDTQYYEQECNKIINAIRLGTNEMNSPKYTQASLF